MRADVLKSYPSVNPDKVVTIRNGVDTTKFAPHFDSSVTEKFGVTGRYAIFVGRIPAKRFSTFTARVEKRSYRIWTSNCATSPDEDGIGKEVADLIAELQNLHKNIWWIKDMLPHTELTAMLTGQIYLSAHRFMNHLESLT